jgi:hypothetical protein
MVSTCVLDLGALANSHCLQNILSPNPPDFDLRLQPYAATPRMFSSIEQLESELLRWRMFEGVSGNLICDGQRDGLRSYLRVVPTIPVDELDRGDSQ